MGNPRGLQVFVASSVRLLAIIGETRAAKQNDSSQIISLSSDFEDALRKLEECNVAESDAEERYAFELAETCICDILLRFEILRKPAQFLNVKGHLFSTVWSQDAQSKLESCISQVQAVVSRSAGSRQLWTGPGTSGTQHDSVKDIGDGLDSTHVVETESSLETQVKKTLSNSDKSELIQEAFLEGLKFAAMSDREEEVVEAHDQTFEWILDEPAASDASTLLSGQNNFVNWLMSNGNARTYWINGKAGSGKSTLMRFLANHRKTKGYLKTWAGNMPLITAHFFFWTSGSSLQRSQSGLLRSLLFDILNQQPSLIPWAFPELWLTCQDTKKRIEVLLTWEQADLLRGLYRALQLCATKGKICLFIDGLDEFEGNESTVIGLVKNIVDTSANVKICVSSRPWAAFERAFEDVPHILLQDLTRRDMVQYITDQLKTNKLTKDMVSNAHFADLLAAAVKQADGVFLWTSLAIRSITHDLRQRCTINDLQSQLAQLPSDLEDLFRHLLFGERVRGHLLEQQSHILQTMTARDKVCDFTRDETVRAISLYQMALAHTALSTQSNVSVCQCNMLTTQTLCRDFAKLLEDSCSHLIVLGGHDKSASRVQSRSAHTTNEDEIIREANRRVHYLHRTVRDFFASSGVWREILRNSKPDFDPHIALLHSHVSRLESPLEEPEQHRRLDEWWHDDVVPAMTHARFASPASAKQVFLLNKLDRTLTWYWRKKAGDTLDTWARHTFATYEERMKHRTPYHNAFLSLAAKFGLSIYLHHKLQTGQYPYQAGIPILSHALDLLIDRRKTVYPLSEPSVITSILDNGGSPNQPYRNLRNKPDTPWLIALKCVREGHRRGWIHYFSPDVKRWVKVLEVMLDYGADPNVVIEKDQWDPEITGMAVIENVAMEYFSADVWRLLGRMRAAGD